MTVNRTVSGPRTIPRCVPRQGELGENLISAILPNTASQRASCETRGRNQVNVPKNKMPLGISSEVLRYIGWWNYQLTRSETLRQNGKNAATRLG